MNPHTMPPHWLEDEADPIYKFATRRAWKGGDDGLPPITGLARWARIFDLAVRGLIHNDATTHAAAMTYTTVLSLVPLLAFVFTMAKAFGGYDKLVNEQLIPLLNEHIPGAATPPPAGVGVVVPAPIDPTVLDPAALAPVEADPNAPESASVSPPAETITTDGAGQLRMAIDKILDFVSKTDVSKLGVVGLLAFLYTAIGLLNTLEHSFNRIFRLGGDRSFGRRVVDYTAVLVLSPVLMILSFGIVGAMQANSVVHWMEDTLHLGPVITILFKLLGAALLAGTFAFLYAFVPNTRVRLSSAMVGGIVGFVLWTTLLVLLVKAQVGVSGYNSLYAGFAAFPIFLFWLYLSWVATMLGAHFVWAHQMEPTYAELAARGRVSSKNREENAVRMLCILDRALATGGKRETEESLARALGLSRATIADLAGDLEDRGLVARGAKGGTLLLSAAAEKIELRSIVAAVRCGNATEAPGMDAIDRALVALRLQEAGVTDGVRTLADLSRGK